MSLSKKNIKSLWNKIAKHKDITIETRKSGDLLAQITYKNKVIAYPRVSYGGGQKIKDCILPLLMKDFKLPKQDLLNFIRCPFSTEDWIQKLKNKDLI